MKQEVEVTTFSEQDVRQMHASGIEVDRTLSQIENFKHGFPFARLNRPCTIGDGIISIAESELPELINIFDEAAARGRIMKFVPASGAASRMFKLLISLNDQYEQLDETLLMDAAQNGSIEHQQFLKLVNELENFAFYDDLKAALTRMGLDIENLRTDGQFKEIVETILFQPGLDSTNLPKGLVKFHHYENNDRTAFEEHLIEAAAYARDKNSIARIHFTISPQFQTQIKATIENVRSFFEQMGVHFDISYSVQKHSTDTIAVNSKNQPFRDADGKLVFRPGGHGALLENLNDAQGDIVFIKNIDNVVPDRLKEETCKYKKALGGYLVKLQTTTFDYLNKLNKNQVNASLLREIIGFTQRELFIDLPARITQGSKFDQIDYLKEALNRPLRVCGMVKNEGEPGGGPFWVAGRDNTQSLQIVESSQVELNSEQQQKIWESATHFNPVDLVCAVRDYQGIPFDLLKFVNPNTGFISQKSKNGCDLKAQELPGLWNGSMAYWNTVFVEVPAITFNPVKTILDLLRDEHQPTVVEISDIQPAPKLTKNQGNRSPDVKEDKTEKF